MFSHHMDAHVVHQKSKVVMLSLMFCTQCGAKSRRVYSTFVNG